MTAAAHPQQPTRGVDLRRHLLDGPKLDAFADLVEQARAEHFARRHDLIETLVAEAPAIAEQP